MFSEKVDQFLFGYSDIAGSRNVVPSIDSCRNNEIPSSVWSLSNRSHKHEVQMFTVSTLPSTTVLLITRLEVSFSSQYLHAISKQGSGPLNTLYKFGD
jgi:hypothetical protein